MYIIFLVLLIIVLILAFFEGNIMIIVAISGNDTVDWSEFWIIVLIAVVIDIVLICLAMAKIIPSVSSSFYLVRSGFKNRRIAKEESAKLKKLLKSEEPDVNRLQELRDKRINVGATKRTLHFCQLIETVAGKERLQDCLSEVREKQSVLDEINNIENKILKVAESCKNAGDIQKCRYYLNILKSEKITPEITCLENECEEQHLWRERESRAIRLWVKVFLAVLITIFISSITIFISSYIEDTPYRELRSMIKKQTLTAEMCKKSNRKNEESYYEYLTSEKGRNLLASKLTHMHKDDDVSKAMWLMCIQPDCIDGVYLGASKSFIQWVVGYAKANGVRSANQNRVTYDVDGYQITIWTYEDNNINDIDYFLISDGENEARVRAQFTYLESNIPIIE